MIPTDMVSLDGASGRWRQTRSAVIDYGRLPLGFEANQGQTDPRVLFLARGAGYSVFLTRNGEVIRLNESRFRHAPGIGPARQVDGRGPRALTLRFNGLSTTARISGLEELPGTTNYFIGSNPAHWRTGVPKYRKVLYDGVYPGIQVVCYGTERHLEQDFVVSPGADPTQIAFRIEGAEQVSLTRDGWLRATLDGGDLFLRAPVAYQVARTGERQRMPVAGSFVVKGQNLVRFRVGPYDHSKALVIDPVLDYSTYLGGSSDDTAFAIAVDAAGEAYVTGTTASSDFPSTAGDYQTNCKPSSSGACSGDAFVTKLSADGTGELFSTYLGGSGSESGLGIALDALGDVYVTGQTSSSDFPLTSFAFQRTFAPGCTVSPNCVSAFFSKVSADGTQLLYSSYLGGNNVDSGNAIAVDSSGNAYVVGETASSNFPVTAATALQSRCGTDGTCNAAGGAAMPDAFVSVFNPAASSGPSSLLYSTYLGGSGIDFGLGVALDSASVPNVYVTGSSQSSDFPVTAASAFQATCKLNASKVCEAEPFIVKLTAASGVSPNFTLAYSTYLGGSGGGTGLKFTDGGNAIAVDSAGDAYVAGETASVDFPVTARAFQAKCGSDGRCNPVSGAATPDAFVAKLNPAASGSASLLYSTYLGGSGFDVGTGIALGADGVVYVTGGTDSTDFPIANPVLPSGGASTGGRDVFVTSLDRMGSGEVFSTYLGGSANDQGHGIAVNSSGDAYVAGSTQSNNFPTSASALQSTNHGNQDAFVTLVGGTTAPFVFLTPPPSLPLTFASQVLGTTSGGQAITLANTGNASLVVSSVKLSGTNSADFLETDDCVPSVAATRFCTLSVAFKPSASGTRVARLIVSDSAGESPQTIALTGQGADFSLGASPTTNTITAGQIASFTLTVTPLGGFNHQVALTCSQPPSLRLTTCTLGQSSVTPANGTTPVHVNVTVATTAPASMPSIRGLPRLPPISPSFLWSAVLVLGMWALFLGRRCRLTPILAVTLLLVMLWVSCGLGVKSGTASSPGTTPGNYALSLNATSTSLTHSVAINLDVR